MIYSDIYGGGPDLDPEGREGFSPGIVLSLDLNNQSS